MPGCSISPRTQETLQVALATVRERAQYAHRHNISSDRAHDKVSALGERAHEIWQRLGMADSNVQSRSPLCAAFPVDPTSSGSREHCA